ncbi:putative sorting nexin-27 [Apostichopus japonicus]|uniref:Putative sorting nexin-27 n=1 Tax=Stichopus japonicus TaxID=307972 RepID=A0A2G8L5F9_STIJA|nr:putative sorting nexin-27 [Apostichopus japonicus]
MERSHSTLPLRCKKIRSCDTHCWIHPIQTASVFRGWDQGDTASKAEDGPREVGPHFSISVCVKNRYCKYVQRMGPGRYCKMSEDGPREVDLTLVSLCVLKKILQAQVPSFDWNEIKSYEADEEGMAFNFDYEKPGKKRRAVKVYTKYFDYLDDCFKRIFKEKEHQSRNETNHNGRSVENNEDVDDDDEVSSRKADQENEEEEDEEEEEERRGGGGRRGRGGGRRRR